MKIDDAASRSCGRRRTPTAAWSVLRSPARPDIAMVLDHCRQATPGALQRARGGRSGGPGPRPDESWGGAARGQAVFGICQGGTDPDLRSSSAQALAKMDFDGYAIGGLSVGETRLQMATALDACVDHLPDDKLRYMMGVGMPEDLVNATAQGVDMFDCVIPTRTAQPHGLPSRRQAAQAAQRGADDPRPLVEGCVLPVEITRAPTCATCRSPTRCSLASC